MNKMIKTLTYSLIFALTMHGCSSDSDDGTSSNNDGQDMVVANYEFLNADGSNSVFYTGQTVRNLIINDIKGYVTSDPTILESMYDNDEANQARSLTDAENWSVATYGDISSSDPKGKIAGKQDGSPDDYVYGFNATPDQLMTAWMADAADGIHTSEGHDIPNMIQKLLIGTVSYYQGTSVYAAGILDQTNDPYTSAPDGITCTIREHKWDESFGYFGASRNYNELSIAEIKDGGNDYNGDSVIDPGSEWCNGNGVNAAKRDSDNNSEDFVNTIYDAYWTARYLISNAGTDAEIAAQRDIVVHTWEKLMAANTIHYIIDTQVKLDALIADNPAHTAETCFSGAENVTSGPCYDYAKYWSEMRAYAIGLQYNSDSQIPSSTLNSVYDAMGTAPLWPGDDGANVEAYKTALQAAASDLVSALGLSANVLTEW